MFYHGLLLLYLDSHLLTLENNPNLYSIPTRICQNDNFYINCYPIVQLSIMHANDVTTFCDSNLLAKV